MHVIRFPSAAAVRRNTAAKPGTAYHDHHSLQRGYRTKLEVFLQLWDEMDDWLNAARHLLARSMT
jgi:hypothetical protein